MLTREMATFAPMACLAVVCGVTGLKFNRRGNPLLGYEWLILAASATCGAVFLWTGYAPIGALWRFFDRFSTLVGVTIIGGLGLLKVTHGVRLSTRMDILLFGAGFAVTLATLQMPSLMSALQILMLISLVFFTIVMALLAWQCARHHLIAQAVAVVALILLSLWVTSFPDFLTLAADGLPQQLGYFAAAHLVWSAMFGGLYLAYAALETTKGDHGPAACRREQKRASQSGASTT